MSIESIQEVKFAVEKAEREIYRASQCVKDMASLCAGRLQSSNVPCWTLKQLKKELSNYSIHTGRWKN